MGCGGQGELRGWGVGVNGFYSQRVVGEMRMIRRCREKDLGKREQALFSFSVSLIQRGRESPQR